MRKTPLQKKIAGIKQRLLNIQKSLADLELQVQREDLSLQEPTPTSEMVSIYEFAEIAGVHYNTVRRWISNGMLSPRKMGSKQYFIREEIPKILRGISVSQ